jgi:hypothetical protein
VCDGPVHINVIAVEQLQSGELQVEAARSQERFSIAHARDRLQI